MSLVEQWKVIRSNLPEGWSGAQLRLAMDDEPERAAAMLAPAGAGRHGNVVTFSVGRGGVGSSPDLVLRLLARLDAEELDGRLELAGPTESEHSPARARAGLRSESSGSRPSRPCRPDWSDVYAEVELDSSDYLERGALLLAPVNPARVQGRLGLPFPRRPALRLRRLGRDDAALLRAPRRGGHHRQVRVLRALSDTKPVYTQGPVWYVGGRAV